MNNGMSRAGATIRALLIVIIAIFGFLNSSEEFRAHVQWWVLVIIGALMAGCIALRGWYDTSEARITPKDTETQTAQVTVSSTTTADSPSGG